MRQDSQIVALKIKNRRSEPDLCRLMIFDKPVPSQPAFALAKL